MSCPHAASGCDYPAGQCAGICWPRSVDSTMDILELVGLMVDSGDVAAWTPLQVVDAEAYAMAVHFRASDNSVTVPPMPAHLRLAILRAGGQP